MYTAEKDRFNQLSLDNQYNSTKKQRQPRCETIKKAKSLLESQTLNIKRAMMQFSVTYDIICMKISCYVSWSQFTVDYNVMHREKNKRRGISKSNFVIARDPAQIQLAHLNLQAFRYKCIYVKH